MSLILGLDCSGETYSAGLWSRSGVSLEMGGYQPRKALRELPEALSCLLKTAGITVSDLSAVGVTAGPGSFTGVRLGVTIAKTVAFVAGCPVCAWDTLELLAHQHLPTGCSGTVAVALDARRSELYCGVFRRETELETLLPTEVRTPKEFAQALTGCEPVGLAVGSGFEAYPELLPCQWQGLRRTGRRESAPSGLDVAKLTAAHPELWCPADKLEPVYHRKADIQVSSGPK